MQCWIAGTDHQPVSAIACDVPKDARGSGDGGYKQVEGAIVVDVATGQSASDVVRTTKAGIASGNVGEETLAVVAKELIALPVKAPVWAERFCSLNDLLRLRYAAIGNGEIE